jgi:hypothetical protein
MIAFIDSIVAGAVVTLGINALLGGDRVGISLSCGIVSVVVLMMAFVAYQRWRFSIVDLATRPAKSTAEP